MRLMRRTKRESGQVSVELLGMIPLLVIGFIATLQLIFAVATLQATTTAARAAARTISQGSDPVAGAERAVPGWVRNKMEVRVTGGADPGVEVTTAMPILLPGVPGLRVTRHAWFDAEHGRTPWG